CVGQAGEVNLDRLGRQHSFIDERAARKTAEIEFRRGVLDAPPSEVKFYFKLVGRLDVRIASDKDLLECGLDSLRAVSDRRILRRVVTPAQHRLYPAL